MWVDVTWGAGGSTADKTMEICISAQKYHGLNVMKHLRHVRSMVSATSWPSAVIPPLA